MDLISLWREKLETGKIRYDDNLLVIHHFGKDIEHNWGTVFYSQAREEYKTRIKNEVRRSSFDTELMSHLQIADFGSLVIAANPNSLFEGHLVIYPKAKSSELTYQNLYDISRLAKQQPKHTFIHNMERSAASILDWAHFQSYPLIFPIEKDEQTEIAAFKETKIYRMSSDSAIYAIVADNLETSAAAKWLTKILEHLSENDNPHGNKIPCNLIWRENRIWIIPRALKQSEIAANYFGGLEMGGIFCLPNADSFRNYLPDALQNEVKNATLFNEEKTQEWFEEMILRILCNVT